MTVQNAEITEVLETTGDKPFVTVLGSFQVIPDPSVPVNGKKTAGKRAFINPQNYDEIKDQKATDIIRAIKGYAEVTE